MLPPSEFGDFGLRAVFSDTEFSPVYRSLVSLLSDLEYQ